MRGSIVRRKLKDGKTKRYHVVYRAGGKQRWKTFAKKRDAETFQTNTVKDVQDGNYTHVKPASMGEVFDRWLSHSLEVHQKQGLLKPSTMSASTMEIPSRMPRVSRGSWLARFVNQLRRLRSRSVGIWSSSFCLRS